jgi:MEDS: MEthanogen/methylotroph, DcmR Sensory domain
MNVHEAAANESPRMVSLGFDGEPYPAGTHMCLIFNDEGERRWVISKYVQSGLDTNEQVSYFVDTGSRGGLKKWMREQGVTLPDELEGRQYSFVEADKACCPDGTFKMDDMLEGVRQAQDRSIREGYVGARLSGEMTWAKRGHPGSENLVEYESRVNVLMRTVPVSALCQYDARRFDGATLYGILSVHPMMVVHGQVVRNPYYIEPEAFLAGKTASSRA